MSITGAIILYATIWFLTLFCVLPVRFQSQAEAGEVVPGTPASAPANADFPRKARITTLIATVLWVVVVGVILSGAIGLRDIDFAHRLRPDQATAP